MMEEFLLRKYREGALHIEFPPKDILRGLSNSAVENLKLVCSKIVSLEVFDNQESSVCLVRHVQHC